MNQFKLITLAALSCLLLNCSGRFTTMEGKLVSSKSLERFKFTLILSDKDGKNYRYPISPEADGHFKVKLMQRGVFNVSLIPGPFPPEWRVPRMTFSYLPYYYIDSRVPGVKLLPLVYVTEPVAIDSPKSREKIPLKNDIMFSWSPDRIVSYYYLTIYKKETSGKARAILTVGGIGKNRITLSEMEKASIVPEKQDYASIIPGKLFKRKTAELTTGEYGIGISGVVALPTEQHYMVVTESPAELEPIISFY